MNFGWTPNSGNRDPRKKGRSPLVFIVTLALRIHKPPSQNTSRSAFMRLLDCFRRTIEERPKLFTRMFHVWPKWQA